MTQGTLLIDLHFLPSLEYFSVLQQFDSICLEKHEHFVKQSYRNRCLINTSQGVEILTVPLNGKHNRELIGNIRIDYQQKWQNRIWRTIESAYRNSPFFEHYEGELKQIIYANTTHLFDFNLLLLSFCLKSLQWTKHLSTTSHYGKPEETLFFDLRSAISTKKSFDERPFYHPVAYYQVFGSAFVPNLSLIDLLMCKGPEAGRLLQASQRNRLNK